MPRTKEYPYWRERVKAVLSEHDGKISDRKVLKCIKTEAEELKDSPDPKTRQVADYLPSERTISRIRIKEWEPLTPPERAQYHTFYWPESMERGDLPWEASAAALELLALSHGMGLGRPTVRNAKWYWRITVAAPTMPVFANAGPCRYRLARWLAMWEVDPRSERPSDRRAFEWYLAYAPWANSGRAELDGDTWAARYEGATKVPEPGGIPPIPRLVAELQSDSAGYAALEELIGGEWAGRVRDSAESQ